MADDYSRIAEWEESTGNTFASFRRENNYWDDVSNDDFVPF
jgi:hypothetical protein